MRLHSLAAAAALALSAFGSQATTIDFDTGTEGASVGTFYPGLSFTGAKFASNYSLLGASEPLGIFSTSGDASWTSANPIVIAFAGGASSFSIGVLDLGENGFTVEAYNASNVLIGSDTKFGPGLGEDHYDVVSVAHAGIASVRLFQALSFSADGVILDNMNYQPVPVPEPSTYALMALGLAGLGVAAGRRKA